MFVEDETERDVSEVPSGMTIKHVGIVLMFDTRMCRRTGVQEFGEGFVSRTVMFHYVGRGDGSGSVLRPSGQN